MEDFQKIKDLIKEKMRKLRKQKKYSQKDVANLLGMSVQQYQRLEGPGKYAPQLQTLYKLCEIYSVHISYFFIDDESDILDKNGNVVLDKDIAIALRSLKKIPIRDRKDVQDYLRFKLYQAEERKQEKKE